jgi:hypothetical protein
MLLLHALFTRAAVRGRGGGPEVLHCEIVRYEIVVRTGLASPGAPHEGQARTKAETRLPDAVTHRVMP